MGYSGHKIFPAWQAICSVRKCHLNCRTWLDAVVNGNAPYGMALQILRGAVRITTHPKVFAMPSRWMKCSGFATFSLRHLTAWSFNRASGSGTFSNVFAQKRTLAATWCRTHGLPHWPSNSAVNGLLWITIMRDFRAFSGVNRHKSASFFPQPQTRCESIFQSPLPGSEQFPA